MPGVTSGRWQAKTPKGIELNARQTDLKAKMIMALDGDAGAYQDLLRLLVPYLRVIFRRRVNGDDVAEDLVQDTLIAVHTKRATYDRNRPFSAWLFGIAHYKLADHFRRTHRTNGFEEIDDQLAGPDFESASLAALDVGKLLEGLSAKQRNAIKATKIEGFSLAEVAAATGISELDAKMSVYRGLRRMSARVQGRVT